MRSHLPPQGQGPAVRHLRARPRTELSGAAAITRTSTRWRCPPRACSAHRKPPQVSTASGGRRYPQRRSSQCLPQPRTPHRCRSGPGAAVTATAARPAPLPLLRRASACALRRAPSAAAIVKETQRRHVNDEVLTPATRAVIAAPGVRRTGNIQIPAQGYDQMAIACAGRQLHTRHDRRLLPQQPGQGLDPTAPSQTCVLTLRRRRKLANACLEACCRRSTAATRRVWLGGCGVETGMQSTGTARTSWPRQPPRPVPYG